jgi:hypothetical protein
MPKSDAHAIAEIHKGWLMVEICFLIAAIVLFNAFPHRIGVLISATDAESFVPLLAPEFQVHMPWLNAWWGLALALAMVKLAYGRWTPALRWAELGLKVFGILLLGRLVLGGPIIVPPSPNIPTILVSDAGVKGILALAIASLVFDLGRRLLTPLQPIHR